MLLNSCLILYFLAALTGYAGVIAKKKLLERVALAFSSVGVIIGLIFMIMRWVETGHPPMVRLFELTVLVSWMIMVVAIVAGTRFKMDWLHPYAAMVVAVCIAAATEFMDKAAQPLVPALQSNWLTFHVITCFVSYSGFAIAFFIGLVYIGIRIGVRMANEISGEAAKFSETLVYRGIAFGYPLIPIYLGVVGWNTDSVKVRAISLTTAFLIVSVYVGFLKGVSMAKTFSDETMKAYETLMYKCVLFGMPLLTIGIVTGAVWANSAWGTYWSWDPKETWSLVTWLIYAIYLHLRKRSYWRGTRAAMLNMIGFAAVLFTWFGVNYLLSGLHSYK